MAAWVMLASACSLLVDGRVVDCSSNTDCGSNAAQKSICVLAGGAAQGRCVQLKGDQCTNNADCLAKGDYTICKRAAGVTVGQCVPLLSTECDTVYGNWQSDDALLFGSVLPTKVHDHQTGKACENAIFLGTEDFRLTANSLPAVPGLDSKRRRPLAFVACDDNSSKDQGVVAARHLVDGLGVPVILGPQWSGVTREIATQVTIPGNTMLISPSATAVSIGDLDDKGLVWRTSPSDTYQAAAMEQYIPRLEAKIRRDRSLTAADKIKVAIVFQGGAYGIGLSTAVAGGLQINGAGVSSATNAGHSLSFNYGDPSESVPLKTPEAVTKLIDFRPDIVLDLCTEEGISQVLVPVENQWSIKNSAFPRPLWVLGDGGETSALWTAIGSNEDLRKRVTGTVPGTNNALFDAFKSKYLAAGFDPTTDPAALGPAGSYDSVYLVAYAAVSLGARPVTGPNLASAFSSLGPPTGVTEVQVGPNSIGSTFTTLLLGGKINFRGASGPLDFDWTKGEAPSDIQIWCMPSVNGKAGSAVNSTLYLDATSLTLTDGGVDPGICDL